MPGMSIVMCWTKRGSGCPVAGSTTTLPSISQVTVQLRVEPCAAAGLTSTCSENDASSPLVTVCDGGVMVTVRFGSHGPTDGLTVTGLSLIHISEPTRLLSISYA